MIRFKVYNSRSPTVGNPIASILKSLGTPALIVLNPVSNFLAFTVGFRLNASHLELRCCVGLSLSLVKSEVSHVVISN